MDILLLQLILWFGMLFLLWSLKDSLGRVETTIEGAAGSGAAPEPPEPEFRFALAERMEEQIGSYRDAPIYRFARIEGKDYQFEHIWVAQPAQLDRDQRCLAPGLVYRQL